jgi:hypothetical protein
MTLAGVIAHKSALKDGEWMKVPQYGQESAEKGPNTFLSLNVSGPRTICLVTRQAGP